MRDNRTGRAARRSAVRSSTFAIIAFVLATGCEGQASPHTEVPTPPGPAGVTHLAEPRAACTINQLTGSAFVGPGGAGSVLVQIKLIDNGKPCRLWGRPTSLSGMTRAGRSTVLRPIRMSHDDIVGYTTRRPALLSEGSPAEVVLVSGIGCQHPSQRQVRALHLGIRGQQLLISFGGAPEPTTTTIALPSALRCRTSTHGLPSDDRAARTAIGKRLRSTATDWRASVSGSGSGRWRARGRRRRRWCMTVDTAGHRQSR